jgi:hypothetical protein
MRPGDVTKWENACWACVRSWVWSQHRKQKIRERRYHNEMAQGIEKQNKNRTTQDWQGCRTIGTFHMLL